MKLELFGRVGRVYCMRARIRSSVVAGVAIVGISAVAVAPLAPPPEPHRPPTVSREVQLTAAPDLGAIPLAFIRNQFQYCSLICPFAVQGAITVPIAAAQTPATFVGSLAATGNLLQAIGTAAASVTGSANAAVTPLINNDVFLVVPKAFHALDVAVVEAFNVGAAVFTPGEFVQVLQNGRANILDALNQPVGPPTTPTGARNILQVISVEAINVTTAVAFQAGELLLAGVVQVADAAAQELARSGDPAAALMAGATRAGQVIATASAPVVSAVNTAVTNISASLADPFPSTPKTTAPKTTPKTTAPMVETAKVEAAAPTACPARTGVKSDDESAEAASVGSKHALGQKPRHNPTLGDGPVQSSVAASSGAEASSTDGSSNDSATPSAKKNTMNSGPPR
ncbi:hypothetical protein [Mycobacterium sp. MMS18-G62]